jgi:hydroxymethylbilane synthase
VRGALNDGAGEKAALAERALLRALEGGCRVPVGALGVTAGDEVRLKGLVASPDGALVYEGAAAGEDPVDVGGRLARALLDQGAGIVLAEIQEVRST